MTWRPWRAAMADALYGESGFYRRGERPARHFRTSAHVSTLLAEAIRRLADEVDAALGRPAGFSVVDVGAGGGEVLRALAEGAPERWQLAGVDLSERPHDLPARVSWLTDLAEPAPVTGLLVANEWLDNVPVDVVEGGRAVLVDDHGREQLGDAAPPADAAWLRRWFPEAARAEVGRSRDEAWAAAVGSIARGVAVAIDYAVDRRRHRDGTLTGYRAGRQVAAVPDATRDLTAHVLMESCAAAAAAAGATETVLLDQRAALLTLGVDARLPSLDQATRDPARYAVALQRASDAGELIASGGLGGFRWLVCAVGAPLPRSLARATAPAPPIG